MKFIIGSDNPRTRLIRELLRWESIVSPGEADDRAIWIEPDGPIPSIGSCIMHEPIEGTTAQKLRASSIGKVIAILGQNGTLDWGGEGMDYMPHGEIPVGLDDQLMVVNQGPRWPTVWWADPQWADL